MWVVLSPLTIIKMLSEKKNGVVSFEKENKMEKVMDGA